MPITIKEARSGRPPVQRNIASLVGGFVIAAGCFVLSALVAWQAGGGTPSIWVLAACAIFAGAVGIWIRLADL